MGVYEAYPTKSSRTCALAPDVGKKQPLSVADDNVFDLPASVDKYADLAIDVARNLAHGGCEFGRDDLLRGDTAAI